MSESKRPRKRLYLINRDFQLRYSLAAVGVGLTSTILTSAVLLYPLYIFEILRIPRFLPWPILLAMILAALINIGLIGFMGILITHRIAGPMYSLVRIFRRIELGKWAGHLRIREADDLRFVVRNCNQMIDGLVEIGKGDLNDLRSLEVLCSQEDLVALRGKIESLTQKFADRITDGDALGSTNGST